MNQQKENKILNISEAANRLGVSAETLRRWDMKGKFPANRHPINDYRYYHQEDIEFLIKEMSSEYNVKNKNKIIHKPFYESKIGKLYNISALDLFTILENQSVDLIFADPPYNIKKAVWDSFESQKEYVEWSVEWISEAHRVLKDTGTLYICGFSEILADIKWAVAKLFKGCKWLIWYYRNKANLGNDWGRSHESILHLRKSTKFIFNIDAVRIPYNQHTIKYPERTQAESSQYNGKKTYNWTPNPLGAKPKDVFEIPTISNHSWERYKHPTQKPVELVRKCILASSNEGQIIVDPFGGSGTTYAVAEAFNREWYGSETNHEYCELISQRLSDKKHLHRIYTCKDELDAKKRREKLKG